MAAGAGEGPGMLPVASAAIARNLELDDAPFDAARELRLYQMRKQGGDSVPPPRFSHGYFALRNRFGILVETHSWKEYPVRVRITRNLVVGMLEQTARHGREWLDAAAAADTRAAGLAGQDVPLDWVATDRVRTVDFRGYAWTRTQSDVSGALATRYDEGTPQVWKMPLRDEIVPGTRVTAPAAGYLVPSRHAEQVARLADGGATLVQLREKLIADGASPDIPVAVLENGTRGNFRALRTLLTDLGDLVRREKVKSPALLVVGEVASYGDAEDRFVEYAQMAGVEF